jgi:endonuclease/exonuclease/phosphatase family metal-dependent hydrolase
MAQIHVATLNLRNLSDRWPERLPLLLAEAAALAPDVFGLQEVIYPMQQDRLLGAAGTDDYRILRGWAGRPEYGNSLLVKAPLAADDLQRVDLGRGRAAHGATVRLGDTRSLFAAVAHLHSPPDDHAERVEQVETLLAWLDTRPVRDQVVVGDFNADPREPAYARMRDAGFGSAHAAVHGAEPAVTWPSGLQAEAIDTDGEPDCLDYIWYRGDIVARDCRVVFNRPAIDDRTLYPSDHFGLSAHLEVGQPG